MNLVKRWLLIVALATTAVFVVACKKDGASDETLFSTMTTVLEGDGYVLTTQDQESRSYFANLILAADGITVNCVSYRRGTVPGSDTGRWARIIIFASETEAVAYVDAVSQDDGDVLFYRDGGVVLETYSQETFDLFDN